MFGFESSAPHEEEEEEAHVNYVLNEHIDAQPALPGTGFPWPALRSDLASRSNF